jgi:hypothetical protein
MPLISKNLYYSVRNTAMNAVRYVPIINHYGITFYDTQRQNLSDVR